MNKHVLFVAAFLLGACGGEIQAPLVATEIEVLTPVSGNPMSAGYMLLSNNSDAPIEITSVSSPQFASVELHETRDENGIARMRPIEALSIEPGQAVRLEPGGKHLMLMRPIGDTTAVTLNLYAGDTLLLSVQAPLAGH